MAGSRTNKMDRFASKLAEFEGAIVPPCNPSSNGPGIYMGAVGRWEWRIVAREEHSGVNLFTTLMYVLLSNPSLCF